MSMRIGLGFDSHAFKPASLLVIGGLKIDHPSASPATPMATSCSTP